MSPAPDVRPARRRGAPARGAAALAAVLVVLVALATASCGLSTNDEPEAIQESVPPDVLDTGSTSTPSTAAGATEDVHVFFLHPDGRETRLVPVTRRVTQPATPVKVLEALINEPPTEAERDGDISTDIPEDVRLTDTPRLTGDGVLIVNLSDDFYELQGETARNAFAQIVFTATELSGVDAVQFEQDGEAFNAVDGDGKSRSDPVGQDAYELLEPVEPDPADETDDTDPVDAEPDPADGEPDPVEEA